MSITFSKPKPQHLKKTAAILIIVAVMVVFLINPVKYRLSVFQGAMVFGTVILPAALPFFFFSKLLLELGAAETLSSIFAPVMKRLYRCKGETAYIFIMSVLSGYPVGAKLTREMYDNNIISAAEAKRSVAFCSTSGPIFIIGSVGAGIFGSVKLGVILLIAHLIGALINGLLYSRIGAKSGRSTPKTPAPSIIPPPSKPLDKILSDSIYSTMIQLLIIGGYVALFYMIADIASTTGITRPLIWLAKGLLKPLAAAQYAPSFVNGLLEMTRGQIELASSAAGSISIATASVSAFTIAWGGLSVHIQNISFLSGAKVKISFYLLSKTTQAIITTLLTMCIWYLIA